MWMSLSFLEERTKYSWEKIHQIEEQELKKGSTKAASPGEPLYMQPPNPNTITDAKKCLLAGTRYGCLLRGSAKVVQMQLRMFAS